MTVLTKSYIPPAVCKKEILRYAGVKEANEELEALLHECLEDALPKISYKLCCTELCISIENDCVNMGFAHIKSKDLAKNLRGCQKVIIFAATLGGELDRLLARFSASSPAKAFMLQAVGAERIEALCNCFNAEIAEEAKARGEHARPRFSPGYGDLPLELQRDILGVLDSYRRIGLTLNQSLLMSPSKSVSAIIGISDSN